MAGMLRVHAEANKATLAEQDVIAATAALMRTHVAVAKIQENCVSIFGNMSYRSDNKAIIAGARPWRRFALRWASGIVMWCL